MAPNNALQRTLTSRAAELSRYSPSQEQRWTQFACEAVFSRLAFLNQDFLLVFATKTLRSVKCLKFGVPKVTEYFSILAHFRHFSSLLFSLVCG